MAEVRPFKGVVYNFEVAQDITRAICPPYDVINEEQREELYQQNKYNFVRIEYERERPQDTATDNKYTRSAVTLSEWLKTGVLKTVPVPAIYLHDHYFTLQGKEHRRRGITLAVRLTGWDEGIVRPHEGTLSAPKADRTNILRTLRANTSPILALFSDRKGGIASLLKAEAREPPLITTKPLNGESHRLWAMTAPETVNGICQNLSREPIYIADGHHRYESALIYQHERRNTLPLVTGEEAFNFVMMTLVDFADSGLIILSPHRLIKGVSGSLLSELPNKLSRFFELETLPLSMPDLWRRVDGLPSSSESTTLALFGLTREHLTILRPRDSSDISRMMPSSRSEIYKRLDVSIIDHIILEKLMGMGAEEDLTYSYDRQDAINRVRSGEFQLVLLVSPVRPETVRAIADVRDRMPRKSTYFYPKAPAGLVLRSLA